MNPRVPENLLYKVLQRKLTENIFRDRGFVLDGFPRNYEDAKGCFIKVDEEAEDDKDKVKFLKDIVPNKFILLEEKSDNVVIERIKNKKQEEIDGTHYTRQDMIRRLNRYRTENESTIGELPLIEFFKENSIDFIELKGSSKDTESQAMTFIKNVFI